MHGRLLAMIAGLSGGCCLPACATYQARPLAPPQLEAAYHARTLDALPLRSFVEANAGPDRPTWPPKVLDLRTLTLIGYYYSADLEIARAQIAVADAAVRAAGARVNPDLAVNAGYDRDPASHSEYGLAPGFTFETAGKRGYRILRAERQADSARIGLMETAWAVRSRIRTAFVNHELATERLELLRSEQRIRLEIVEMFDRRLAAGEAARSELDVYRIDLITTDAAVQAAGGEVAQTRSALANAVGVPISALPDARVGSSPFDAPPAEDSLPIRSLQRAGVLHRADLQRSLAEYAAVDAALRLELARQYPDVVLSPGYTFEEGFARYVLGGVLQPVALFHRNQGPIAVAEAQRLEAGSRFEALQVHAIGDMERALVQYRAALEEWRDANDRLVVVQRDREGAARRALEAGVGDRLSLATVRLQTATAARTRLDALTRVQNALGSLEDAMQQPLEAALRVPDPTLVSPRPGAAPR
jgi:cobalt-zinc-cadmium efflux system outer membrane protein